jgi:hypothetical protein
MQQEAKPTGSINATKEAVIVAEKGTDGLKSYHQHELTCKTTCSAQAQLQRDNKNEYQSSCFWDQFVSG